MAAERIWSPATIRKHVDELTIYNPLRALTAFQAKAGKAALQKLIRSCGYDSVTYDWNGGLNYVVFDPSRIKFRFAPDQEP